MRLAFRLGAAGDIEEDNTVISIQLNYKKRVINLNTEKTDILIHYFK
jgi:hypothetical protein